MPRNQINITLGTAGHIDHGKTALIKCLTGCETDRLKEEKQRGMSIELGYAPCTLGSLEVGIVDVPGHENFIRTMVAGASGMDACMLVVAADDGPMPQTREHLDILTLLDVRHGVIVLTKIDRVSAEEQQLARQLTVDFVRGTFIENAPILPVSNVTGDGLGDLYKSLSTMVAAVRPRPVDGVFRLPVERAFSIKGHGTVIAGVPTAGSARVDDEIVLMPDGLVGRIKAIQVYGQDSPAVLAGQCAALNIRHWDHRVIERGKTVTTPGFFEPHAWCIAQLRLLPQDRLYLKHGATVRFHTGTSERIGRVYLMQGDGFNGGQNAFAQFRFDEPIIAGPRDRFIIRDLSPPRTIGGGIIIETVACRLNRNEPGLIPRLSRQLTASASDRTMVEFCAETADEPSIDTVAIAHRAKVPTAATAAMLDALADAGTLVRAPEGRYLHRAVADDLGRQLLARLAEHHRTAPASPGLTLEEIRLRDSSGGEARGEKELPPRRSPLHEPPDGGGPAGAFGTIHPDPVPPKLSHTQEIRQRWDVAPLALQAVVEWLRSTGQLAVADQRLALPEHRPVAQGETAEQLRRVEQLFQTRAFNPPESAEIAAELSITPQSVPPLIRILIEHKRLVRVDRDLLFHIDAIARARELIISHVRVKGRLESVGFKYLLDTSRKYAIPLLDYFDRTGLTRRCSDNTRLLRNPENPEGLSGGKQA